jgi:hypothetical protein
MPVVAGAETTGTPWGFGKKAAVGVVAVLLALAVIDYIGEQRDAQVRLLDRTRDNIVVVDVNRVYPEDGHGAMDDYVDSLLVEACADPDVDGVDLRTRTYLTDLEHMEMDYGWDETELRNCDLFR